MGVLGGDEGRNQCGEVVYQVLYAKGVKVGMVTARTVGPRSWALETGWAERAQAKSAVVETGERGYDADKMSIDRPMGIVGVFLLANSSKYQVHYTKAE